jgi:hypothetical protein
MDESAQAEATTASRGKFLLLVCIAFVPIVTAYLMYFYMPDVVPDGRTNQGQLMTPPVRIDTIAGALSDGRWVLLQLVDAPCERRCEETLHLSQQLRTALGKDSSRVSRAVVVARAEDASDLSDGNIEIVVDAVGFESLAKVIGGPPSNHIFLMDPNGNIMMWYSPDQVGKSLLKDLKHLLRISNIG